jgi:hypothetical protein
MAILYEYYNTGDDGYIGGGDNYNVWTAQTFTPEISHYITLVKIKAGWYWHNERQLYLQIYAVDVDGVPTGNPLYSQGFSSNDLPHESVAWVSITFGSPVSVSAGTKYAIVLAGASTEDEFDTLYVWMCDTTSPTYAGGEAFAMTDGGGWFPIDCDMMFEEYGNSTSYYGNTHVFYENSNRDYLVTPNHIIVYANATYDVDGNITDWDDIITAHAYNSDDFTEDPPDTWTYTGAYMEIPMVCYYGYITAQEDADNKAATILSKIIASKYGGRVIIPHDSRVELYDKVAAVDNRGGYTKNYPTSSMVRVTSLVHRWQSGKGVKPVYQLEIGLGGFRSVFLNKIKSVESELTFDNPAINTAITPAANPAWYISPDEIKKAVDINNTMAPGYGGISTNMPPGYYEDLYNNNAFYRKLVDDYMKKQESGK